MKPRLLFVVQRYGLEVNGGAELYCRWLAEHLSRDFHIEIATTCAKDYITWANFYPVGKSVINGIPVHRFANQKERRISAFNTLTAELLATPRTRDREISWLEQQGPFSPDLIRFIDETHSRFDTVVFFTYLYYSTVMGIKNIYSKSILIPTAHDEPVAYFSIYRKLFSRASGLLFLTKAEMDFVLKTYAVSGLTRLLGTGIDLPVSPISGEDFISKYNLKPPIILYVGRVEEGKGCGELIQFFQTFQHRNRFSGSLVLVGKVHMQIPDNPGIHAVGFVPDELLPAAFDAATIVSVPSPYESLSILLLQGMFKSKPVLANAKSPVLLDHCIRSNGGLFYNDMDEFLFGLELLLSRSDIRNRLGINGKKYVQEFYNWHAVRQRFRTFWKEWSAAADRAEFSEL